MERSRMKNLGPWLSSLKACPELAEGIREDKMGYDFSLLTRNPPKRIKRTLTTE
jgi:hypothetical protein